MSVVNKMLRDLDNRGHTENGAVKNVNYVAPNSSKRLYGVIGGLSVLCVVVASYSVYLMNQTMAVAPAAVSPETVSVEKGDQYAQLNTAGQIPAVDVRNLASSPSVNPQVSALIKQNKTNVARVTSSNVQNDAVVPVKTLRPPVVMATTIPNPIIEPVVNFASAVKPAVVKVAQEPTSTASVVTSSAPSFESFSEPSPAPSKAVASASSSEVNVAPSNGEQTQLSSLRARAHMASQQNDNAQVTKLLREILFIAPLDIKVRKKLAALLFSANELSEARQVLSKGIKQTPSDSSLRLMLSRLFFKLGDNDNAFTVLAEHPYSALANDELVSFRAALAEKTGQYEKAQKDYQILVQRNPQDAKWWLGLGVSQDKQKFNKQAVNSYQQAQSLRQLPEQVDTFLATRIQLLSRSS